LKFQGRVVPAFTVESGVRQGCPLSAAIYVIATDAVLRYILAHVRPTDCLRAYADDLEPVLYELWETLPSLQSAFDVIAAACSLELNVDKCYLIPGWNHSNRNVKALLREQVPSRARFEITKAAICLGFGIGPEGHSLTWKAPTLKYADRLAYVSSLGVGLASAICLYNIFAASVLQYVAQLRPVPQEVLDVERRSISRLIPARGNWISPEAMWNISGFLPFRQAPLSIAHLCSAVETRCVANRKRLLANNDLSCINEELDAVGLLTHPEPHWLFFEARRYHARCLAAADSLGIDNIEDCQMSMQRMLYIQYLRRRNIEPAPFCHGYFAVSLADRSTQFDAHRYLLRRLRSIFSMHEVGDAAAAAMCTAHLLVGAAPRILSIVLKLWLNAWPLYDLAAEKYRCVLCKQWRSTPTIRHFVECPLVKAAFNSVGMCAPRTARSLLLLTRASRAIVFKRARVLHALHSTACHLRRTDTPDPLRAFCALYAKRTK